MARHILARSRSLTCFIYGIDGNCHSVVKLPAIQKSFTLIFSSFRAQIVKNKKTGNSIYSRVFNAVNGKVRPHKVAFLALATAGGGITLSCLKQPLPLLCAEPVSKIQTKTTIAKKRSILRRCLSNILLFIRLSLRSCRLVLTFTPLLLLYPVTFLGTAAHRLWWRMMLVAVEMSGPAFVKLGQWTSTRRDLFSKEFCDRFSRLHDRAKAHSWRQTVAILEKAYGMRWKEMFLFDNEAKPVGSGCVAQVYKAYVREESLRNVDLERIQDDLQEQDDWDSDVSDQRLFAEGVGIEQLQLPFSSSLNTDSADDSIDLDLYEEPGVKAFNFDPSHLIPVAIKVLHPGVQSEFSRDLTLMSVAARCTQLVFPSLCWVSLTECVAEFAVAMRKQMSMRHEAHCLNRLAENFSTHPNIRVPLPMWPLIRNNVLVESFEEGEPISNFLCDDKDHIEGLREKLAELGVDALLQMVFVNNFVHGDLHPGNILVQNAAEYKQECEELVVVNVGDTVVTGVTRTECPLRLVFLDCGITATLSEEDRIKFREVFTAVVKGEGETVADLFLEKTTHVECANPAAFRRDMTSVVMKGREALNMSKIHVAELLAEVFTVLQTHRVKMECNFATVILAIAVLEGLGRSLDPDMDILEKARPVLLSQAMFS